ncbi:MAG: thioredoxin domain-containing protein [Candidatus Eisenbacteria bacterium]
MRPMHAEWTNRMVGRIAVGILLPAASLGACSGDRPADHGTQGAPGAQSEAAAVVQTIASAQEFEQVIASSGDRLLMFDLYADWCGPCRMLSPILEELARDHAGRVTVYKINVDQHRDLAAALQVTGIPLVVFMKDRARVAALTGLQPKEAYVRAIERFASPDGTPERDTPDGAIVGGRRVIRLASQTAPEKLFVYRGETVALILEPTGYPYTIHIPALNVSGRGTAGAALELSFKIEEVGVYPLFCNGRCPTGDGEQMGVIVAMSFAGEGTARFTEMTAREAHRLIASEQPLVLDVRTPNEYLAGHLPGALLIPLDQLDDRISEIAARRDQGILLYCRSGNRSTVAAEILIKHGFTDLNHLRGGIREWAGEDLPVTPAGEFS